MKSIKMRLLTSHFIAITFTVILIEAICLIFVKNYYYNNIEENLKNQAHTLSVFYSDYFSKKSESDYSEDVARNIYNSPNFQVQILSKQKKIVWDSLGIKKGTDINYTDTNVAINKGKIDSWIGIPDYTNEKCICVSYPVSDASTQISPDYVIRLVSSLKQTDNFLRYITLIFIAVGIGVIFIISLVSIFISNSIIKPLNNVISAAKKMAQGDFSKKITKKHDDEVGTLSDTLNYMEDEILRNEKLKNDFISSVSHELRTPLTSIIGWAITLNREDFTDKNMRHEALGIIVKEGERLSGMVEELLDFSKLEAKRIVLNIEDVDLRELIIYILNQMSPKFTEKSIKLCTNLSDDSIIQGDSNRLKQVFINIIDNAIKFTESGGEITVSLFMEGEHEKVVFQDTGCGIDKSNLTKVVKKFYKTDMRSPGSGIGLAVCDEIIRLHKGTMNIESIVNKGTRVTVCLNKQKQNKTV